MPQRGPKSHASVTALNLAKVGELRSASFNPSASADDFSEESAIPLAGHNLRGRFALVRLSDLKIHPQAPRKHSRRQIRAIARSIKSFGFNAPLLLTRDNVIIAGVGRWEAARLLGLEHVSAVFLDNLNDAQIKAYMLADNKLTDRSSWDEVKLAQLLKDLSEIALDFKIEDTGFETPEIDIRIQSLEDKDSADREDEFELADGPAVTIQGDTWFLGEHRVHCGNALEDASYSDFFPNEKAAATFVDLPYNVKIDGHVSGTGEIKHREFAMASGELSEAEFIAFLCNSLSKIRACSIDGALIYACMDWRHIFEMCSASRTVGFDFINLCVWSKTNGGLGSLYRSQHELVFVLRNGKDSHVNNVQLGRFGRNRTNVWHYAGVNNFTRKGTKRSLELHPTVKPVLMVADAILDSTKRNDVVLDPFLGSGTTLLAAQRKGRRCYGIEIDPIYVDTAIARWQRQTGEKVRDRDGVAFDEVKLRRVAEQ